MKKRLVLLVFCFYMESSFSLEALFPALPDRTQTCEEAKENLQSLQKAQFLLKAQSGVFEGQTLMNLDELFDRQRAYLSMLKGMKLLNNDYIQMRSLLDQDAPTSSDELLEMAKTLSAFQERIKQVRTSNQILDILLTAQEGQVKTLLQKLESGDDPEGPVSEFFKEKLGDEEMKTEFSRRLGRLLGMAIGEGETTCGRNIRCLDNKLKTMREQIVLYQDVLIQDISETELGTNNFAEGEYRELVSAKTNLEACLAESSCEGQQQALSNALKNYRDKVRSLQERDGVESEIAALKDFMTAADKLRADRLQLGGAGELKISKAKVKKGGVDLTNAEKTLAHFRAATKTLLRNLTPENRRVKFLEEGDLVMKSILEKEEDTAERIQNLNDVFSYLTSGQECSSDECQVVVMKERSPQLDEQRFFKGLEKLDEEQRRRLKAALDGEIKKAEDQLKDLSKAIDKIKKGKVFQDGEYLKRYAFDTLRELCKEEEGFQITCQRIGRNSMKELILLANDTLEVLAVQDQSLKPENLDGLNATCGRISESTQHAEQGVYRSYRKACKRIEYEYERAHPEKRTKEFVEARKERTPRYTRRGRLRSVETHHSPWTYMFAGLSQGIGENMDALGLALGGGVFDGWLDYQTELGMEQKEYYHQYPQYQKYMDNQWIEQTFQRLNPDIGPGFGQGVDLTTGN